MKRLLFTILGFVIISSAAFAQDKDDVFEKGFSDSF